MGRLTAPSIFDWLNNPQCDFCDQPATQGIRDPYPHDPQHLARSGDPEMGSEIHIRKSYPGPWRFVCDEHKAGTRTNS